MNEKFDFLVIGGGSAGYAAARTAHGLGLRTAVCDGAKELGGLCILRGCMPSKTLIYSAEVARLAALGGKFGLDIPQVRANAPAMRERKQRLIGEFAAYRQSQLTDGRFSLYRKSAHFLNRHTVQLSDGTRLQANSILIATGSTVAWPNVPGLRESQPWTSDDLLDAAEWPESMIVLGGGVVACELAQFLCRVGVRVVQIQRSERLLKNATPMASSVIETVFREEGIEVITGTRLRDVNRTASGNFVVAYEKDGELHTRTAQGLLNALGRVPKTDDLRLEEAGIQTLPSGHIACHGCQETNVPGIYAAGDCAGPHEIVHVAIQQGEVAARHAAGQAVEPVDYRALTTVVFTDPQVAYCGLSPEELQRRGEGVVSAAYPFNDHGKSLLMEAVHGYVRIWIDRENGVLLAAECVGKDAGELIHSMAVAIQLRAEVRRLGQIHWYHPTLSEIWSYPLEECAEILANRSGKSA